MNQNFEQARQEYVNQPVPQELKAVVLGAVKKAKKEKRFLSYRRIAVSLTAAAASFVMVVNVNPDIAYAMEAVPILGEITKVVTFRSYEKQDGAMQIQMEVPHINETGNGQAREQINEMIDMYMQEIERAYEADVNAAMGLVAGSYDTRYQTVTDNADYFVLRIDTTVTKGSAAQFSKFFTIDKQSGQLTELNELFAAQPDYLERIRQDILTQMTEQMAADESITYDVENLQAESISEFYISTDGHLVIVFDEYEVAPGYMGAPEFIISDSVFSVK